ncbi:MAG: hypothetical protein MRJ93_00370 [Nitrososphaeraceae archaeon]|nr:hypothetical protein [Nitrososphaeraceae archaeon]
MNNKTKIGSMFLLAAVLVTGAISMTIPSSFAQPDDRDDRDFIGDNYYEKDPYNKYYNGHDDPFGKDQDKEYKDVKIQKIKCVNFNVNINGIDIKKIPREMTDDAATAQGLQGDENGIKDGTGNGMFNNGGLNIDKNLVNICLNLNFNNQEKVPILGDLTRTAE